MISAIQNTHKNAPVEFKHTSQSSEVTEQKLIIDKTAWKTSEPEL
jgi:hypothetical protein